MWLSDLSKVTQPKNKKLNSHLKFRFPGSVHGSSHLSKFRVWKIIEETCYMRIKTWNVKTYIILCLLACNSFTGFCFNGLDKPSLPKVFGIDFTCNVFFCASSVLSLNFALSRVTNHLADWLPLHWLFIENLTRW